MQIKVSLPYSLFLLLLLAVTACTSESATAPEEERDHTSLVDVFIGTGAHGHTYPGAVLPFGMVQLSPDNGTEGWDWCSGYHYSDTVIAGFSHLHLSGTGIGDLCDISVMPYLAQDIQAGAPQSFNHNQEQASPGFYGVTFDNGIKAELTATRRVGMHRYTFPEGAERAFAIDLGFRINWDMPTETSMQRMNGTTITGVRKSNGWSKDQRVYFAAVFSEPPSRVDIRDVPVKNADTVSAAKAFLAFPASNTPLVVKVGISSASIEGALANIEKEVNHWDFNQVVEEARAAWEGELAKIDATFIDPAMDTIFYSALYHTSLAPALYSDVMGQYKGVDSTVHTASGYERYTVFSLWDTFRAAHPLYTITQTERLDDFLNSILAFYEEYGLLPVWALTGHETNTMTGYHAVPVLADALLKGHLTDKAEYIYEAMLKSAGQNIRGTNFYREYGYIPADKDSYSVTKTLEYAYDDWCIAQIAKKLGKEEDYEQFMKRSRYYKALFDPQTKFMRGKNADGSWVEPFDPFYSEHGAEGVYIEGTAWQHSWFVPHDTEGLIALFGSDEALVEHLDATFSASSELRGENVSADISGLIGQYAHGNEPSHHIAYLYNFAGQPRKTQERVRNIMETMYTTAPDGLSGNEDCGQMSAWYVFSAMGFYPFNPADGRYAIGSPLVKDATIRLPQGRSFRILAENNSRENKYVKEVYLNGEKLERWYITHEEVMKGGELRLVME
ncbi:MAG: glycoside hydrolase family 92 protein [Lewinellaceae bacterium]|nr:glycoside hydrolase family 92 protein [Lewinellaceae bacterium]